jgi:glucose/mannose-6-phosphate isomerase
MSTLDNRSLIRQLDPNNYLSHLVEAPEQLGEGYELGDITTVPALFAQAKQVVFLAVGEMVPVAMAVQALMNETARVPVHIIDTYTLPAWVSSDTLVIAIDYYGTTDQVLTTFQEAAKRRARMLALSVGGDLARESRRFRGTHVPLSYGAPARAAFYYTFACLAQIVRKLGFIDELRESTVTEAMVLARALVENIGPDIPLYQNNAKQLAEKMATKRLTMVISGASLAGVAKKWQVGFASTSKTAVLSGTVNEFNDTIINGIGYQSKVADAPLVIMLQSKYDHQRVKVHQTLTYQVAQAQKIAYEQVFMHPSGSFFGEIVLSALLGDMVSYYLALLLHWDPSTVEATTFIRERLNVANQAEES